MNFEDWKQKALPNLKEEFWYGQFICSQHCPECENHNDMLVTMTKKSVRIHCQNKTCSKVFFYRRVSLGASEGFKIE